MPYSKDCSYHLYWIRVKNRNQFMKKMSGEGIETGIHYRPVHTMSFYRKKTEDGLPITNLVSNEIVTLPIHPNLSDFDVDYIIKKVNNSI